MIDAITGFIAEEADDSHLTPNEVYISCYTQADAESVVSYIENRFPNQRA